MLTNVDNTIQGQGQLGANTIGVVNQSAGVIDGNVAGESLTIDASTAAGLDNDGTLRASGGGELAISGTAVDNENGVIEALAGSTVAVSSTSSIANGILRTEGTGVIEFSNFNTLTDVVLQGNANVLSAADLALTGTITNEGNVSVADGGSNTDIVIGTAASLTGGGSVALNGPNSRIFDTSGANGVLTNVDNTIQGQGQLGANTIDFDNQLGGVVNANVSGQSLTLNTSGSDGLSNTGVFRAENGGTLQVIDSGFTNEGIVDTGVDSTVAFTTGVGNGLDGIFQGEGTISSGGIITNEGQIGPGSATAATLTVLATELVLADTSELVFDIEGATEFDVLSLTTTDALTLNGDLAIALNGFNPNASDTFTILDANLDLLGSFDNVFNGSTLTTLGGEGTFVVNFGIDSAFASNQIVLNNFVATAIPEPATGAMFALVGLVGLTRRRRS